MEMGSSSIKEGGLGFWPSLGGSGIKGVDTDHEKYKDNVTKL